MKPEVNLQSLLARIKSEGISEAQKEAEAILEQARAEADAIRDRARAQASESLQQAEIEVRNSRAGFERAMSQAARDLVLAVKGSIIRLCDELLKKEVAAVLTPEMLGEMILNILTIIAPVAVCIGAGYLWSRTGHDYDTNFVTRLIMNLGAPFLVLSSFQDSKPVSASASL